MTKPDDKLEPCPFCGGEASMWLKQGYSSVYVMVRCKECHSEGPAVRVNDRTARPTPEESAAEGWNTRSPTDFAREDMREMTKPDDKLVCGLGKLRKYLMQVGEDEAAALVDTAITALQSQHASMEGEVARKDEALRQIAVEDLGASFAGARRAVSRCNRIASAALHKKDDE